MLGKTLFSCIKVSIISVLVSVLSLLVLSNHSNSEETESKDCGVEIYKHEGSDMWYGVTLYDLKSCNIKLPGMSQNGYFFSIWAGDAAAMWFGGIDDWETRHKYYFLNIDGDTINEVVIVSSDLDNRWGAVYRVVLDSLQHPKLTALSVPVSYTDLLEEERSFTQLSNGSLLWPGSDYSDTNYVIYYDSTGDSLGLRIQE